MSTATETAILDSLAKGVPPRVVGLVLVEDRKRWFGDLWTRLHYQPGVALGISSNIATKTTEVRVLLDRGAVDLGLRPCHALGLPERDARRHWTYRVDALVRE